MEDSVHRYVEQIPRFLRSGPKESGSKTERGAAPNKTRLQTFLARRRPSLSRLTAARLISLNITRAHAGTGFEVDLDWG